MIRRVPGFRSNDPQKKALAATGYLLILLLTALLLRAPAAALLFVACSLAAVALVTNAFGLWARLPRTVLVDGQPSKVARFLWTSAPIGLGAVALFVGLASSGSSARAPSASARLDAPVLPVVAVATSAPPAPTAPTAPTAVPAAAAPATAVPSTAAPATAVPARPTASPAPRVQSVASAPCLVGQIKANFNSMIYHAPGGASYARTNANVMCFDTEALARASGFTRSST